MFERYDRKLFILMAVFMPTVLGSGLIYKAHDTQYILRGVTKNSSFLHFRAVFMSCCP
jgi:hypothetical protein